MIISSSLSQFTEGWLMTLFCNPVQLHQSRCDLLHNVFILSRYFKKVNINLTNVGKKIS